MSKDLYMPQARFIAALKRMRSRISEGLKLSGFDDTTIGAKDTQCTWGLCTGDPRQWPEANDHLWPEQFEEHGRVAPRYRVAGQHCPLDAEHRHPEQRPSGCFYRCRFFQRKHHTPSREQALKLYDEAIERAEECLTSQPS
jgi:hypothetical protein